MNERNCRDCLHYEEQHNARNSERWGECRNEWKQAFILTNLERSEEGNCGEEGKHFIERQPTPSDAWD